MADRSSARAAILDRIAQATGGASTAELAAADWQMIPRAFKRDASHAFADVLSLLTERLIDYDAQVLQTTPDALPGAIHELLTARAAHRLVVPAGLPEGILPPGFDFTVDTGFFPAALDTFDGIVTLATVAIAETGTVVLQNTPGQGPRAATLVPDYHLCIVHAADVVETVPEAVGRLQATATLSTTFVSGPSATADIEMTRIKGVHGPRFLDVILVADPV